MENEPAYNMDMALELFNLYGINLIAAILILIIGWTIAGWSRKFVIRLLSKSERIDATLSGFFSSLVRYIILIFTILAVLDRFGVETASLITILAGASLAIGLALQGTLSNVAAGVMLLIFRPFKLGDFIEAAGHAGTVKDLGLFVTELATGDNVQIIIPNSKIWGDSIKNISHHDIRRIDLVIGIGYDDDIDLAFQSLDDILKKDERALSDPAPAYFVDSLGDSSVNIGLRVWAARENFFALKCSLIKNIKHQFDEKQISFPYPQQDIHVVEMAKTIGPDPG